MMEARGRRVGGGFPGYSGPALPRAMRSARGRGESCRQPSDAGGRAGFFELLATVAGQFLQDASVGQEHETDKQKRPQFVESVLDTNSQTQSEEVQVGDSPQIEIGNSASADGDIWEQDIMLSTESTLPVGDAHSPAANSCQSNSAAGKTVNLSVVEDAVLASGVGLFSEVVSPQSTDVKENDPANSAGCRAECYVLQDVNVAQNPEGQLISADCYSGTAHTIEVENPAISLSEGRGLVNSSVSYDENCGMCKSGECLHNRRGVHLSEKGFCNIVREESHSCDITEQEHIEEQSKDSRGPNCDSCDGPVIIQEETVEQIISGPNPVKHVSDMVKDHGDVSVDVYMGTRNEIEDDLESNRCVCKADEKVSRSPCDEVEEKPITEAGNSLSVNVSSIEEVLGSEEGEQVGAQSKYNVHTGPGKVENGYHVSERKEGRILRGHSGDVSQKTSMKDSCSKVLKARKFAKAGKRSRICGSRTKRKRSEIEAQADADFVHGNKGIFGNIAFTRQRTPRPLQAKRKKMENETDDPLPDLDLSTKTADVVEGEPPAAAAKLRSAKAASVASSPTAGSSKNTCKKSGEPHVKLSIKSFTVPELFVDLPESATIANLKRAVMDAAMNLLGGGLRVRVLLQGKKIPDEGMSLGQMGISRHGKPDSLGFMLEPSPLPASPNAAEDPLLVLSRAASQPSQRYPVFSVPGLPVNGEGGRGPTKGRGNKGSSMVDADSTFAPMACDEQSSGDPNCGGISFGPTPDDLLKGCNGAKPKTSATERMSLSPHSTRVAAAGALAAIRAQADASRRPKTEADSAAILPHTTDDSLVAANGAIILHPGIGGDNLEGMALVPVRQKMRSVDTSKRRIRRPFSVTEVEALVHAVEKLGTGRWRDVKLRAFDQAKHRTYVDLKDKWKTLVHTARIAPHQRRGEPVPQELLERVTRAHTYWTAQQAKQQAELDF